MLSKHANQKLFAAHLFERDQIAAFDYKRMALWREVIRFLPVQRLRKGWILGAKLPKLPCFTITDSPGEVRLASPRVPLMESNQRRTSATRCLCTPLQLLKPDRQTQPLEIC